MLATLSTSLALWAWDILDCVGLFLVLAGVLGEIYFEKKEEPSTAFEIARDKKRELWSGIAVVGGLALEMCAFPHHISETQKLHKANLELVKEVEELQKANAGIGAGLMKVDMVYHSRTIMGLEKQQRFISVLKQSPGIAEIIYKPGDDEAFGFANELEGFLTMANWKVVEPKPIPEDGKLQNGVIPVYGPTNAPIATRIGLPGVLRSVGLMFNVKTAGDMLWHSSAVDPTWKPKTPGEAMIGAFNLENFGGYRSTCLTIKEGVVVIVVGQNSF